VLSSPPSVTARLDKAAIAERMLREYAGTVPDAQLIEEIGLAMAVHRSGG